MKQSKYSGDMPAHATAPAHSGGARNHPTPKVPPAYQALYGQPQEDNTQEALRLFRQLSGRNKVRMLTYCKALASDDQATADRMKQEIETELAYLQRENAGGNA